MFNAISGGGSGDTNEMDKPVKIKHYPNKGTNNRDDHIELTLLGDAINGDTIKIRVVTDNSNIDTLLTYSSGLWSTDNSATIVSGSTASKVTFNITPEVRFLGGSHKISMVDYSLSGYLGAANSITSNFIPEYLLDIYSNAAFAGALRRLNSDYTNALIEVRRGGDNNVMEIGYNDIGDLDTDEIIAFANNGDGNAFIKILFDQSGNGRDLSQGTDNKQPQIVSSGSVLTRGGKPAIQFDGANDNLWAAESSLHNGHNNQSVFILADSTGSNDKDLLVTYSGANDVTIVIETHGANNLRNIYAYNGSQDTNLFTSHGQFTGNQKLITFIATPTQYISRVDGANQQTGARTKSGPNRDHKIVVGSLHTGTLRFYDGRMQEILIYDSDQSADMADIEANMTDYWVTV